MLVFRPQPVYIMQYDVKVITDCLPVGKGNFRFRQFFDKVNSVNPDASVILELYRNSFRGISDLVSGYNILANMTAQYKNRGD